jgi:anti-sigma B factor antagonist
MPPELNEESEFEDKSRLTVEVDRAPGEALVRLSGRLEAGVTDGLYFEVKGLIPQVKRIVLDLTDLTHMDSMGLGTLVRLYVSAGAAGCDLELVNLGKRIRQLLGMTNLMSFFTIIGENDVRVP